MEPCRHERSRFITVHDVSLEVCVFCGVTRNTENDEPAFYEALARL